MKPVTIITRNMAQAIGTTKYIRHNSKQLVFTDGVHQLRADTDGFWLVDAIASYQHKHNDKPFQLWELKTDLTNKTAVLTMKEDTDEPELVRQEIKYTDFPLDNIKFYVEGGYVDGREIPVLLLPSEH